MRIIGGTAKGTRLYSVPGLTTRPITDRVKEALFNILGVAVQGARFLDLFAGTGSVGIEALSRGAALAVFVERDKRAIKTIQRNLRATHLEQKGRLIRRDVFDYLSDPCDEPFDFIYIAPPQYRGLWTQTLMALDNRDWLAPTGWAIVQIYPKEYEALNLHALVLSDQRRYGSTLLCFYTLST
ncbi:MAG: 16S rRNA (guanine(966)-N(2))-methyltransferase RsmD [Chloroflexi bacterium]|nr:16S rRNA (guanine(966)-N(2))-methyltransferase RsmD [Chloroflexota bacterium]